MKRPALFPASLLGIAALLLLGGCSSCEMKGSPFYTGEYQVNVPGAEARRVNLWPLAYYREPALSVAWPVFEHTEEHLAVRPLFSVYGDTHEYWEYNFLWPLCQADVQSRDYRIFPFFWGEGNGPGNKKQDYHILFPLAWHYEDETCALFPLWINDHGGWRDGRFTEHDLWLGWPLFHYHAGEREEAWHAGPIGRYRYPQDESSYAGYPWPLLFSWRDRKAHGLFTPLYAYESSTLKDAPGGWTAIPPLLSWTTRQKDERSFFSPLYASGGSARQGASDGWAALPPLLAWYAWQKDDHDLNLLLGLYSRQWSDANRSGRLLPLYLYDRQERLFLSPLAGWDKPDARDPDGYWYPLTPLAGVRTGTERGGWLFPLFNRTSSLSNDTYSTRCLLLGYAKHEHHDWRNSSSSDTECGFFPLYSRSLNTFTNSDENCGAAAEGFSRKSRRLLLSYSEESQTLSRASTNTMPQLGLGIDPLQSLSLKSRRSEKSPGDTLTTRRSSGLFPLWSSSSYLQTRENGTRRNGDDESALLVALYDTKREFSPGDGTVKPLDYERRRILWRLWHYEKRNGDVSVDIFPAITYDARADGFRKTSFLWRLYRYERHPEGGVDLDLLFLPLRRAK